MSVVQTLVEVQADCRFAHGEEELRVSPSVYKTQLLGRKLVDSRSEVDVAAHEAVQLLRERPLQEGQGTQFEVRHDAGPENRSGAEDKCGRGLFEKGSTIFCRG